MSDRPTIWLEVAHDIECGTNIDPATAVNRHYKNVYCKRSKMAFLPPIGTGFFAEGRDEDDNKMSGMVIGYDYWEECNAYIVNLACNIEHDAWTANGWQHMNAIEAMLDYARLANE